MTDPSRARLVRALDELGIPVEWPLTVVSAVGMENVFVGASVLGGPLRLLVPVRPALLVLFAPGAELPQRSMLLMSVDATDHVSTAAVIGGPIGAREAIEEVGPPDAQAAWYPVVESLTRAHGGVIKNRTRHLDRARGTVTVSFAARDEAKHAALRAELSTLTQRLKIGDAWQRAYDDAGPADVGVTTACDANELEPQLGLRYGPATWDDAIDLAKAVVGTELARNCAVRMGMLAGGRRSKPCAASRSRWRARPSISSRGSRSRAR